MHKNGLAKILTGKWNVLTATLAFKNGLAKILTGKWNVLTATLAFKNGLAKILTGHKGKCGGCEYIHSAGCMP